MEPKCEHVVSPGSVDTVPAYNGISLAGAEVSQLTKRFPVTSLRPKCFSLNAECNTEQLICEVKLKNVPITTDKDFIKNILAWILPK